MTYSPGDRVTVTSPIQPTRHKGGETGKVTTANGNLVRIREDDGRESTVHAEELSPAT
ncbi:hypothetical protein [Streptomyces sp. NBRC 109706]|uniref:hypothetical protein n=1 Tax=Streptomyces sp. NBRC 109706 TaxID=1550035 RepID=UPI000ACF0F5F|nr:hypothetical protein [Streptomyces sp. NBRC 109706]